MEWHNVCRAVISLITAFEFYLVLKYIGQIMQLSLDYHQIKVLDKLYWFNFIVEWDGVQPFRIAHLDILDPVPIPIYNFLKAVNNSIVWKHPPEHYQRN